MKGGNFSKPGNSSIICSNISTIPYSLIFTTKFNDTSIFITIISLDYMNVYVANEYVCDVTITTQVIMNNQCCSRLNSGTLIPAGINNPPAKVSTKLQLLALLQKLVDPRNQTIYTIMARIEIDKLVIYVSYYRLIKTIIYYQQPT